MIIAEYLDVRFDGHLVMRFPRPTIGNIDGDKALVVLQRYVPCSALQYLWVVSVDINNLGITLMVCHSSSLCHLFFPEYKSPGYSCLSTSTS